jgi:hypothetical protein
MDKTPNSMPMGFKQNNQSRASLAQRLMTGRVPWRSLRQPIFSSYCVVVLDAEIRKAKLHWFLACSEYQVQPRRWGRAAH